MKYLIKLILTFIIILTLLNKSALAREPVICKKPDICGEIIFDPTVMEVPITLQEALSIVLDKNFDIKIFLARKNRDKWRYYQIITNFLPDLTYDFRLTGLDGTFLVGDILSDRVSETAIESNFFLRFNLSIEEYFNLKEALYTFSSSKKEVEFSKDEALLETARRYYELLRAKLDIEILRINVEQIEEQFQLNKIRVEAGIGTQFDVLRAEADREDAIQRLYRRENQYRLAQAQLANVLGIPVFIQLVPQETDVLIKDIFCDCFNLETANNYAINKRDDLAARVFDIKAAKQRKNAGYSIYFPEVFLIGQYASQGTLQQRVLPAKRLTLLVEWRGLTGLGFRGYTEVKARDAELEEQRLLYINDAREAQENLVRTFSNTITAKKVYETTFKEVKAAAVSRELALIRYKEELSPFIDVIQTQTTFTSARLENLEAVIGYNISQIELLFEMGVISVDNILYGFDSGTGRPNTSSFKSRWYNQRIMETLEKTDEEYKQQELQAP